MFFTSRISSIQRIIDIHTVTSCRLLYIVKIHCCLVSISWFQSNNTPEHGPKFISPTFSESRDNIIIDALFDNSVKNWDLDFTKIWVHSTLQHFKVKFSWLLPAVRGLLVTTFVRAPLSLVPLPWEWKGNKKMKFKQHEE